MSSVFRIAIKGIDKKECETLSNIIDYLQTVKYKGLLTVREYIVTKQGISFIPCSSLISFKGTKKQIINKIKCEIK